MLAHCWQFFGGRWRLLAEFDAVGQNDELAYKQKEGSQVIVASLLIKWW